MSSTIVPMYYETSWSILSTIGLTNVLFGMVVVGITGLSPVIIVPIVVSAASAIANGLCYYAFYAAYPITQTAVASAFADLFWLIQEAGLSFYSYQILSRILPRQERKIFMSIFWFFIFSISYLKFSILVCRVLDILHNTSSRISLIDHLHIGYFLGIAFNEVLCSYFLLRLFFSARQSSRDLESNFGLFRYLTRSTEIRLTALAFIGITRTITYSFQKTNDKATNVAGQIDRFIVTLECVFPIIMYIDILAAKSIVRSATNNTYVQSQTIQEAETAAKRSADITLRVFPLTNVRSRIDDSERSGSQEYIFEETGYHNRNDNGSTAGGGEVNNTTGFEFHKSTSV